MNSSEAAKLLAHAAAFDRRTVGEADARAWAAALHDIPFGEDALAAVAAHYAAQTRWLMPADIRAGVKKLRGDRAPDIVGAGQPAAVPDADPDDPRAYLAAIREQRTRAVNGEELISRPVAALVASAATARPERRHSGPLGISCPRCHSVRGERCHLPSGKAMLGYHPARLDAMKTENADTDTPPREETA